jgi:transposase
MRRRPPRCTCASNVAHIGAHAESFSGFHEILDGITRVEEKLRIVAETHEPGGSVRAVAARHDVYPNLLRTWQRLVRQGRLSAAPTACFMPVRVLETAPMPTAVPSTVPDRPAPDTIEISLPDGSRVRVGSDVNLTALRRVMTVLRG